MDIGIQTFFMGGQEGSLADYVRAVGSAVEDRGFSSLWVSEHVLTFPSYDPRYPYPYAEDGVPPMPLDRVGLLDTMTTLTALAMCTERITLGTSIAILPQRNPVYFAKMATGIDLLSNGRFVAGIGIGWSGQEMEATGTPWEHRGPRTRDYVEVVRSLWVDEVSSFSGTYYDLPECVQLPKPIQRPHPPMYFGGDGTGALRRVVDYGQGWLAFNVTPESLGEGLERLDAMLAEQGRARDVDIIASPGVHACDAEALARFAELGVSQVFFTVISDDLDTYHDQLDQLADTMLPVAANL